MADFSVIITTAGGGAMTRVDGREALLRSVDLFVGKPGIKQVVVIFAPGEFEEGKKRHGSHFAFTGVRLAAGGPTWADQVAAGMDKVSPESTHVLVHDGARCVVPASDIEALQTEVEHAPTAAALVGKLYGTLVELDEGGAAIATERSSRFVQLLSPVAYTRKAIETVAKTRKDVPAAAMRLVPGSPLNVRVSEPGDEKIASAMIALLPKVIKVGDGPFGEAQW